MISYSNYENVIPKKRVPLVGANDEESREVNVLWFFAEQS